MLHIVFNSVGLNSCESFVRPMDAVLFIGDAAKCAKSMACSRTYLIESDSKERENSIPPGVSCVGYDEFVELVVEHASSVTWS